MLIFDLETDGLLDTITKIHSLCIIDSDTGNYYRYTNYEMKEGLKHLSKADTICGHNIIMFDLPALKKLYGFKFTGKVLDTIVMSRVIFSNLNNLDWAKSKTCDWIPVKYFGRHSLEAWGLRLCFPKDDYADRMKEQELDPWAEWSKEMEEYCIRDCEVTLALFNKLDKHNYSQQCLDLEHSVAKIVNRQIQHGFMFDVDAANKLYGVLSEKRDKLYKELADIFGSFYKPGKLFTPKRDNKTLGYIKGVPIQRKKLLEFNPNSADHIANRLMNLYDWKPDEFTPSGKPKVDEKVLRKLKILYQDMESPPPLDTLIEYMLIQKRIAQLAEGDKAWLRHERSGRIHGSVNTGGTITGRMTHQNPNMGQVVSSNSPYGTECRSLFTVPEGFSLVGVDVDALELRVFAHMVARIDGGEYGRTVVSGKKGEGNDAHSVNQRAIGLHSRANAKTWYYAWIYGAGDHKLGDIVYQDIPENSRPSYSDKCLVKLGRESRRKLERSLPALGEFVKDVRQVFERRGYLYGLDRRRLYPKSIASCVNSLVQGAGAVVTKKALVILDELLLPYKNKYEFVANVHDEWQIECESGIADIVGKTAVEAIKKAGEHYNLRCEMDGHYGIGKTWATTH